MKIQGITQHHHNNVEMGNLTTYGNDLINNLTSQICHNFILTI